MKRRFKELEAGSQNESQSDSWDPSFPTTENFSDSKSEAEGSEIPLVLLEPPSHVIGVLVLCRGCGCHYVKREILVRKNTNWCHQHKCGARFAARVRAGAVDRYALPKTVEIDYYNPRLMYLSLQHPDCVMVPSTLAALMDSWIRKRKFPKRKAGEEGEEEGEAEGEGQGQAEVQQAEGQAEGQGSRQEAGASGQEKVAGSEQKKGEQKQTEPQQRPQAPQEPAKTAQEVSRTKKVKQKQPAAVQDKEDSGR